MLFRRNGCRRAAYLVVVTFWERKGDFGMRLGTAGRGCRVIFGALLLVLSAPWTAGAQQDPEGLWRQASLYRDAWGVPHVQGRTVRGMAFAFGYAQAEDHLETMLLAYRYANGRAAEVLGEAFAASDQFSRKLGHRVLAEAALANADAVTRDLCAGFALGVNAWMLDHPGEGPAWAEPVQPRDVLSLWHSYLMSFAPFDLPGAYRQPPAAMSGNAWAVAPRRMEKNKTALVFAAHQFHDGPFRWYEGHLACEDLDVAGATLMGLPVILQGHNRNVAWAFTPNAADWADMFEERLPGGGGDAGATDIVS